MVFSNNLISYECVWLECCLSTRCPILSAGELIINRAEPNLLYRAREHTHMHDVFSNEEHNRTDSQRSSSDVMMRRVKNFMRTLFH